MSGRALGVWLGLLVIPGLALSRLAGFIDWRALVVAPCALSVLSFFSYRSDKRRAEAGERRIPKSSLHLLDLLGGWPGAFLAQRIFSHKTSKVSFQFSFWLVVLVHEYLAADFLLGWRLTQHAIHFLKS